MPANWRILSKTTHRYAYIPEFLIKIKPKIYFIIGSILTLFGSISAFIVSIFLIGLIRFSLRTHLGRGAEYKLDQMLSTFPWWIIILTILSLIIGIWLIRKYDFSYKINFNVFILEL